MKRTALIIHSCTSGFNAVVLTIVMIFVLLKLFHGPTNLKEEKAWNDSKKDMYALVASTLVLNFFDYCIQRASKKNDG